MKRGNYDRRLQRKRTRPTDEDLQVLIALINQDERTARITVIRPLLDRGKIIGSFATVLNLLAGTLRPRQTP